MTPPRCELPRGYGPLLPPDSVEPVRPASPTMFERSYRNTAPRSNETPERTYCLALRRSNFRSVPELRVICESPRNSFLKAGGARIASDVRDELSLHG